LTNFIPVVKHQRLTYKNGVIIMGTKRIEDVDKNFVSAKIGDRELVFLDILNKPFEISGLGWLDEERQYCRLPVKRLPETNEGVQILAWHTAGAMLRFRSNSRSLAIRYELRSTDDMSHIPRTAISGFDLFQGVGKSKTYLRTAIPVAGIANVEALMLENGNGQMTEWTLNFPLYNGVKFVQIGVDPGSQIDSPTPFRIQKPILFYGSYFIYRDLEEKIRKIMGTKVSIQQKQKNKGKIEIEYYSEDELERIVELIETIV
jgi:hypothetical protein